MQAFLFLVGMLVFGMVVLDIALAIENNVRRVAFWLAFWACVVVFDELRGLRRERTPPSVSAPPERPCA